MNTETETGALRPSGRNTEEKELGVGMGVMLSQAKEHGSYRKLEEAGTEFLLGLQQKHGPALFGLDF